MSARNDAHPSSSTSRCAPSATAHGRPRLRPRRPPARSSLTPLPLREQLLGNRVGREALDAPQARGPVRRRAAAGDNIALFKGRGGSVAVVRWLRMLKLNRV